jgi:phosphoglycerate dehydrogenase-like enzyme
MPMPEAVLKRAPRCRLLVRAGVGFDSVDLAAAGSLGIPVCNVPDYGTTDVADHAVALVLALRRALPFLSDRLRADPVGNWDFAATPQTQQRLRGQTVGIVGLGRIGLAAARRAAAFDMPVGFYDPYLPVGEELATGYRRFATLEELLAWADVVSVHTPLTDETRGMFGAAAFAAMKPGAVLVNTARGPIVDIDALHEALRSGGLGGAGLDVLPEEPPDPAHPLIAAFAAGEDWLRGRLYLTPHAAFACPQSLHDLRRLTGVTVREYVDHGRLRACVNEGLLTTRR